MNTTLKVLDLFSGIGGFSLGLERTKAFKTVAFCEIEKYCQLVLQNHWKGVRIYNDVRRITKEQLRADGITNIDVITGGFPCQPFSVAGKQKGTNDDRHLWPEMFRIIKDVKPKWIIGENVKNLINIQDGVVFETVCTDLENAGYEVQTFNIPAASVGAPHQRERIWIVAHAISDDEKQTISRGNGETDQIPTEYRENNNPTGISSGASGVRSARHEYVEDSRRTLRSWTELGEANEDEDRKENANQFERPGETRETVMANSNPRCCQQQNEEVQTGRHQSSASREDLANTSSQQSHSENNGREPREAREPKQVELGGGSSGSLWPSNWEFEPDVGRVADGIPGRAHRLKGLGNSIVPQIAEEIGKAIKEAYETKP